MLAATWLQGCTLIATVPALAPMRISQTEANALGSAWAAYIEQFPSERRKATMKMLQNVMPTVIAFGSTLFIFLPRVQLMQAMAAHNAQPRQQPRTEPTIPPPWRPQQQQAPPPPTEGDTPPVVGRELTKEERREIIDGMDPL